MVSMCRWFGLVVLLLAACASPPPPPPRPLLIIAEHPVVRAATVILHLEGTSYCGAVAIGPQLLVSARHCIDSGVAFFTTSIDDPVYDPAWVIASDPASDLTLLATVAQFQKWPAIRPWASIGEPVYSLNHANGSPYRIYDGHTLGMADGYLVADVWVRPGASGCGLFSQDDELVGIVSKYERDGSAAFFGSSAALRRLIESVTP